MITLTGSRTKETYNKLSIDDSYVASWWGKITRVEMEETGGIGKLFVAINGTVSFVHGVDRVVCRYPEKWLESVITIEIKDR